MTDVAALLAYGLLLGLLGARLIYILLNIPDLIWTRPLEIVFPFEFTPAFHATDALGFSIHGAAAGILLGTWLYSRKNGRANFFYVASRASIVAMLTGFFLFTGSSLNSNIAGKPAETSAGIIYIRPVIQGLQKLPCCIMRNPDGENPLVSVIAKKDPDNSLVKERSQQGVLLYLFFKPGATEQLVNEFLIGDVKTFLFDMSKVVYEPGTEPLHFTIIVAKDGQHIGRVRTVGIARYPVYLIEAILCFLLFVFLMWYWNKHRGTSADRSLLGYAMIIFWSSHLLINLFMEDGSQLALVLDILFILLGLATIVLAHRKRMSTEKVKS
jgi:prolipoprotein diacylglyceryltransferase